MTEKQNAEMLELANYLKDQAERLRRMLDVRELVPGRPQLESCLHAFTSAGNTVRQIALRAAAPSPHPREEAPSEKHFQPGWLLRDVERASKRAAELRGAAPPPAGADAVRERGLTSEEHGLMMQAVRESADEVYSLPAPQPQENPGDPS